MEERQSVAILAGRTILPRRPGCLTFAKPGYSGIRSQGGVQFPTGGKGVLPKPASAVSKEAGQQIRLKSGADG